MCASVRKDKTKLYEMGAKALMRGSHGAKYLTSHYNHTRSNPKNKSSNLLKRLLGRRTSSALQKGY